MLWGFWRVLASGRVRFFNHSTLEHLSVVILNISGALEHSSRFVKLPLGAVDVASGLL